MADDSDDDSGLAFEDPLIRFALNGDLEGVQLLLQNGHDPDAQDENGYPALHYVLRTDIGTTNIAAARLLVQHGADVDIEDRWNRTPLNAICYQSHRRNSEQEALVVDAIRFLLLNGASPNVADTYGETPFTNAIRFQSKQIISLFLENKADVTTRNLSLNTPMHLACKRADLDICNLLIDAGADFRQRNADQETPLHLACQVNCGDLVKRIIKYSGSDILTVQGEYGYTPLHVACVYRCVDNVKKILLREIWDMGGWTAPTYPCVHALSNSRKTPLRVLFDKGKRHVSNENQIILGNARLLIRLGANVNSPDDVGKTALHSVTAQGNVALGEFLLNYAKAKVNSQDGNGETCLHIACRAGNKEMIQLLMVGGADCWTENRGGGAPFTLATLDTLFFLLRNFHSLVIPPL